MPKTVTLASGQDHLAQSLVYSQVLSSPRSILNAVLTVRNRMVAVGTGWLSLARWFTLVTRGRPGAVAAAAQHYEGGSYHILLAWEKVKIPDWKNGFNTECIYCFYTIIKLKNCQSNRLKLGTIHTHFIQLESHASELSVTASSEDVLNCHL